MLRLNEYKTESTPVRMEVGKARVRGTHRALPDEMKGLTCVLIHSVSHFEVQGSPMCAFPNGKRESCI
jgi:hypothetical protein